MRQLPVDDPEGPWIALFCVGLLLTALSGTVCLGVVALYSAKLEDVESVLACFATGALLMLGAAARLDHMSVARTHRR